jgi:hypothetical protein
MTMIERVARAQWEARRKWSAEHYDMPVPLEEWGDGSLPISNGIMQEARAAIEAMREPTDAMISDGWLTSDRDGWDGPGTCWNWMIDAALKETP